VTRSRPGKRANEVTSPRFPAPGNAGRAGEMWTRRRTNTIVVSLLFGTGVLLVVACSDANEADCGGVTVDLATSNDHCGACGKKCARTESCSAGACVCTTTCEGVCIDTAADRRHCGGCGRSCAAAEACVAGTCTCEGVGKVCGGACVDNLVDNAHCGGCNKKCTAPQVCTNGACECAEGPSFTPCGAICVETSSDPVNCGVCKRECAAGQDCVGGECQ
jgi:hypothetical protein